MERLPEETTSCEASEPLAELDHSVFGVGVEPIDEVGNHDFESDEVLGIGIEGAIGEPLHHDHNKLMVIDLKGHVDGAGMVFVAQNERERFVDSEAKVVDCSHRQSFAARNRGHADTCQAHEPHR